MSEKKEKEARREEKEANKTIVAEFLFTAYANGRVDLTGPIDNFLLFRDVMNAGERMVIQRFMEQIQAQRDQRIIKGPTKSPLVSPDGRPLNG